MILKTLILKNYRKYKDATIEFPDGITGIIGFNGVGKSTIFEAIAWVLYGSVAARTSADQIKRNTSEKKDHCKVILDFQFDEDAYRVIREMSGKNHSSNAKLIKNSSLIASGAVTVNRYIQKEIGMDFKSFYTSIFAKQKELNALSIMNASERRPLILKMLGIDSLDDIIREIKSDKKTKEIFVNKLSIDLKNEKGKNKIVELKEKLKSIQKNKKSILQSLNKNKNLLIKSEKELKNLEQDYKNYKNKYEQINEKIEELNEKKNLFEKKQKLKEDLFRIKKKIEKRKKEVDIKNKDLEKFVDLSKNIDLVNYELIKIEKSNNKVLNLIQEKKTISKTIKNEILNIIDKKREINNIGNNAKCPTCQRILGDQYNYLIDKYNKDISEKNKKIRKLNRDIEIEEKDLELHKKQKNGLDKRKEYLFNQLRLYDKITNNIKIIKDEIIKDEQELNNISKKITDIRVEKFDYEKYSNNKKLVKKYYLDYQNILKIFNNKKDNLNNDKLIFQKKENELKFYNKDIKDIKEKIDELKKIKKQIVNETNEINKLKILQEIMTSFRSYLILGIKPILSLYATELFSNLTEGKYQNMELDDNYNIIIYDNGIPYSIKRYSGGEEDLANLCLRLSISEVLTEKSGSDFNFIILDEIFGSQDVIHQQNIIKSLKLLSSKFKQIFLITHVEDIKNYVENIITVNESEDGTSKIKIN